MMKMYILVCEICSNKNIATGKKYIEYYNKITIIVYAVHHFSIFWGILQVNVI